jgi:hypothetical protein
MPRCDSIFMRDSRIITQGPGGPCAGVSTDLYRFSRSRRVLLYKSIGRNDRRHMPFPLVSLADWDTSPLCS